MRGQPGALGADGVLGDLHHQWLAFAEQLADRELLVMRRMRRHDFLGMDECGPFETDVDEGRLHAGQHSHHLATVDVADDAASPAAFDEGFLQDTVLDHRHAGLHRCQVDQYLAAHSASPCKVVACDYDIAREPPAVIYRLRISCNGYFVPRTQAIVLHDGLRDVSTPD